MAKTAKFKISVSVSDSPFLANLDYMFAGLKQTGVDGIEIIPGIKSRWNLKGLKKLAAKYDLSVLSFHQPPWSVLGFWFDEEFLSAAGRMNIKNITFHPPAGYSFSDPRMKQYLQKLARIRDKYSLNIFLENMPETSGSFLLNKLLPYHQETTNPVKVFKTAEEYGLGMTLDISHARSLEPHKEKWFTEIYPGIRNIHLSSLDDKDDHLPLHLGNLKSKDFIKALVDRDYSGLITFEIFYPKRLNLRNFDFESIRKSVDIIKSVV